MKSIPPLNPLRAFEASARTGSISKAAEELHVTPTAISRHVKTLEDYLEVALFHRRPSSLELTPAGRTYAISLSRAFEEISRATKNLKSSSKELHLSVRSYTTFMVKWLMPRLATFQLEYPQVHVQLSTGYEVVDLERDRIDVWIRYGRGHWPGFAIQPVFKDRIRPFAASSFRKELKKPDDLQNYVLLRHSRRADDWRDWLEKAGVRMDQDAKTLDFDDLALVFEAADSGMGIGITQEEYLKHDQLKGKFYWPFTTVLERDTGYFALASLRHEENPAVGLFLDWLGNISAAGVLQP